MRIGFDSPRCTVPNVAKGERKSRRFYRVSQVLRIEMQEGFWFAQGKRVCAILGACYVLMAICRPGAIRESVVQRTNQCAPAGYHQTGMFPPVMIVTDQQ
jgi:hypothetical protein